MVLLHADLGIEVREGRKIKVKVSVVREHTDLEVKVSVVREQTDLEVEVRKGRYKQRIELLECTHTSGLKNFVMEDTNRDFCLLGNKSFP